MYFDGFVARADPAGSLLWALHIGSDRDDEVAEVHFDDADRMVVGGLVDDAFTVQVFDGTEVAWSWCSSDLYQVYSAPSGDAVILAPWVVEKDLDLGAGVLPGFGGSDIVVAKIRP